MKILCFTFPKSFLSGKYSEFHATVLTTETKQPLFINQNLLFDVLEDQIQLRVCEFSSEKFHLNFRSAMLRVAYGKAVKTRIKVDIIQHHNETVQEIVTIHYFVIF